MPVMPAPRVRATRTSSLWHAHSSLTSETTKPAAWPTGRYREPVAAL
jgi:hypothetical protein